MKKIVAGVLVVVLIMAGLIIFNQSKPVVAGDWTAANKNQAVLPNKIWMIPFTKELDDESIHENSIYITDGRGEKLAIDVKLHENKKSVILMPPEDGYIPASSYTLHIDSSLKAIDGKEIRSDISVPFQVIQSLPVVGSKEKLEELTKRWVKEKERMYMDGIAVEESIEDNSAMKSEGEVSYSETNVQVKGIDEADRFKTDGTHIYYIRDNELVIMKAYPAEDMEVLAELTYESGFQPQELFYYENKLVVIGYSYDHDYSYKSEDMLEDKAIMPIQNGTEAIVYDITTKEKPVELRRVTLEGSLVSSRRIGSKVYLVANHWPNYWLLAENKKADVEMLIPRYKDSVQGNKSMTVSYDELYYIPDSAEGNFSIISAFDLEEMNNTVKTTTFLGSGHQFYMSHENIYLAVTKYPYTIERLERERDDEYTSVYKFAVDGLDVVLQSSADMPGHLLNQFSMDEHAGHFRAATTVGYAWDNDRPSSNSLYIFDENMKRVGAIEGLARGERIYSARFMGDRAYVVTFKETDPLFVFDLSDPAKPIVLGELKIPGFSNYLHPYGDNHLIGFGHDTRVVPSKNPDQEPRVIQEGVKISVFDITDVNNPKEKFTEIIGGRGTYSPLNHDHKALLFNEKTGLFAFPIAVYNGVEGSEWDTEFQFQGGYVYNIDLVKGIQLQGSITHQEGTNLKYHEWESEIQRLLYIDDTLYAISNYYVSAHDIKNITDIKQIKTK
ncbi:beta-propeller domain-containing protein [Bacillus salinus]|uniref:beta-propeller domain-containing protein n=1 Tax=Bacillus sp. HMF5848 TaxID=2495421 RepID=UPI00163AAA6F|nr:beta-propeller domain-containing protein [Bacillus sp. HMF5848]